MSNTDIYIFDATTKKGKFFRFLWFNEYSLLIDDPKPVRQRIKKKPDIFGTENIFKANEVFETDNVFKK